MDLIFFSFQSDEYHYQGTNFAFDFDADQAPTFSCFI